MDEFNEAMDQYTELVTGAASTIAKEIIEISFGMEGAPAVSDRLKEAVAEQLGDYLTGTILRGVSKHLDALHLLDQLGLLEGR